MTIPTRVFIIPYRDRPNQKEEFLKIMKVLLENLTWERACEIEIKMISFYGRADLGLGTLVNWTDGGEGAKNPSEEARKKLSDRTKGENNPMFGAYGELNPMYGRCGELHPFFGVERLDHSKKMTGEGNPMYGKAHPKHLIEQIRLKNIGKKKALVFVWSNEVFDIKKPDTIFKKIRS